MAPNNRPIVLFCLFSAYFESKTNSAKWQRDTETSKDDKEHKRKETQSRNSHTSRHKETRKTFVMLSNEMQNVGGNDAVLQPTDSHDAIVGEEDKKKSHHHMSETWEEEPRHCSTVAKIHTKRKKETLFL